MFFTSARMADPIQNLHYLVRDHQDPVGGMKTSELRRLATRVMTAAGRTRYLRELRREGIGTRTVEEWAAGMVWEWVNV